MSRSRRQKKKIRIAYVTPTLRSGGAEQHIALLCSHLDRDRYEPVVFCLYEKGPFAAVIRQANVPGVALAGSKIISFGQRLLGRGNSAGRSLRGEAKPQRRSLWKLIGDSGMVVAEIISCLHLVFELRAWRIDLVSAHWNDSRSGLLAAWLAGIPAIYTEHSIVDELYAPGEVRLLRRLVPLARRVIAVSQSTRRSVIEYLNIPPERVDLIGHAVQFDILPEVNAPAGGNVSPIVAVMGSLKASKGHIYFLQAARLLLQMHPDTQFMIAGDGSLRAALEKEAGQLGLHGRVRFLGAYENSAVPCILQGVSVVAVPSLSETFGIVALEAMACGVPVVASAVGGLAEVVSDGETGLLVPPRDPAALAAAIARLLDEPALRKRLGRAGREFARRHPPGQIAAQTMSVYKRVIRS